MGNPLAAYEKRIDRIEGILEPLAPYERAGLLVFCLSRQVATPPPAVQAWLLGVVQVLKSAADVSRALWKASQAPEVEC